DYIYEYQSNMGSISWNGDVAQLLSTRSAGLGGIAFLDGNYCSGNANFAFSNIWTFYGAFPSYSWTIDVVTHEFGHTLGSPHTHSCSWSGGAIDNCYTPEGSCGFGPPPASSGGTIMSYCHLTSSSKDFTLSFGPQPSNLILNNIDNMTCLQPCAPVGCDVPSGLSSVALSGGATVSWSAVAAATSYTVRGRRGTSPWRELSVSGTSRTVTGLGSGRTFEWQAQAICGGGVSAWSGSQFFTTFSPRVAGYDVELTLVPNPVQDQLQISTNLTGELVIEIYDIAGKRWISRIQNIEEGSNVTINGLTELPTGHYTIQLISSEGTVSGRFVK
ncbi:MAG: hypothetical protein ACI959_002313, partial [Limisphaerales bacterium]